MSYYSVENIDQNPNSKNKIGKPKGNNNAHNSKQNKELGFLRKFSSFFNWKIFDFANHKNRRDKNK